MCSLKSLVYRAFRRSIVPSPRHATMSDANLALFYARCRPIRICVYRPTPCRNGI